MRLIAEFKEEKEAYGFHLFLLKQNIENVYDFCEASLEQPKLYRIWVVEENDLPPTLEWYRKYVQNSKDPLFQCSPTEIKKKEEPKPSLEKIVKFRLAAPSQGAPKFHFLTRFLILICAVLFFWDSLQENSLKEKEGELAARMGLTALHETLYFDTPPTFVLLNQFFTKYPISTESDFKTLSEEAKKEYQQINQIPVWKGVLDFLIVKKGKVWESLPEGTLFGKIRQGEFWRLFTPCLLHGGILHILFNIIWVWVLGRQIEERIGALRMAFVVLLTGIVGNIAQYLMSGPEFLGISGVVMGMIGFIWIRQKKAPWEGYPLHRSTLLFITIFILAMGVLEVVSLGLQYFEVVDTAVPIANTAHIIGALTGILCAYCPIFSKRSS